MFRLQTSILDHDVPICFLSVCWTAHPQKRGSDPNKDIIAFANRHRLPAIYGNPEFTDDGGLIVYGPNFFEMSRRLASFVDRILKGAKPAELPFEQAAQFDLKVNLKTARELGLTVPALILGQATEIIE